MGIMFPRSAAIWAFAQQRNIKAPRYWLFAGGIYRWPMNSRKKGQWHGKCVHLMTPSWSTEDTPKYRSVHYGAWLQYIPRNMHTVFALLCFVVVIHWPIFPYPPGLLHWHCGNLTIAPVPAKQPWWIWINTSCEFIKNDCITTTKQSTAKPCAYFLGYTVYPAPWNAYTGQSRTWRLHMETLTAWLYICEENPPVPVDSPRKSTVVQIFGVSSFGSLNKLFDKQSSCRWFRHIDANVAWLYPHCRRYSAKSNCASSVKRELWFVRTTNLTLA